MCVRFVCEFSLYAQTILEPWSHGCHGITCRFIIKVYSLFIIHGSHNIMTPPPPPHTHQVCAQVCIIQPDQLFFVFFTFGGRGRGRGKKKKVIDKLCIQFNATLICYLFKRLPVVKLMDL